MVYLTVDEERPYLSTDEGRPRKEFARTVNESEFTMRYTTCPQSIRECQTYYIYICMHI